MKKNILLFFGCLITFTLSACGNNQNKQADMNTSQSSGYPKFEQNTNEYIPSDIYNTSNGELEVTLVGHGSLMFKYDEKVIQVDPYSNVADYSKLPKADLILLTHEHGDHLDKAAIEAVRKDDTRFIVSEVCNQMLGYGDIVKNGDTTSFNGISIEAVPAYNIAHIRPDGVAYHPKGRGNGYILTFGDKKVYVAADTENISEMDKLKGNIYIAFLPKNLPYTMDDAMFVNAAKKVLPTYLYPYHMSEFDKTKIEAELEGSGITILERKMSNK